MRDTGINRYTIIGIVGIFILFAGCAPWPPLSVSSSYYLSDSFDENIDYEIVLMSIIDARSDRSSEIKDIKGYNDWYEKKLLNYLQRNKNYLVTHIKADTSACLSVTAINNLDCLTNKNYLGDGNDLLLLISIDEYTTLEAFPEYTYKSVVSGGLYSKKLKSFIWKDTRSFVRDNDRFLGVVGDALNFGHFLGSTMEDIFRSDNKIFLNRIMGDVEIFLWDFPPYIEGNQYEKQIKSVVIEDY